MSTSGLHGVDSGFGPLLGLPGQGPVHSTFVLPGPPTPLSLDVPRGSCLPSDHTDPGVSLSPTPLEYQPDIFQKPPVSRDQGRGLGVPLCLLLTCGTTGTVFCVPGTPGRPGSRGRRPSNDVSGLGSVPTGPRVDGLGPVSTSVGESPRTLSTPEGRSVRVVPRYQGLVVSKDPESHPILPESCGDTTGGTVPVSVFVSTVSLARSLSLPGSSPPAPVPQNLGCGGPGRPRSGPLLGPWSRRRVG